MEKSEIGSEPLSATRGGTVRSQPEKEKEPNGLLTYVQARELDDGTRADPPTFRSAPGVSWKAGDKIPLTAERTLRVLGVRDDDAYQPPVLAVEDAARAGD